MIKLSSGKPIKVDKKTGERIFGNSLAHTVLLLYLLCRSQEEAGDDAEEGEVLSPWRDRPEIASGRKAKDEYIREIYEGIDLVPAIVLELVIKEMLEEEDREFKPSLRELQVRCRAAMRMEVRMSEL